MFILQKQHLSYILDVMVHVVMLTVDFYSYFEVFNSFGTDSVREKHCTFLQASVFSLLSVVLRGAKWWVGFENVRNTGLF